MKKLALAAAMLVAAAGSAHAQTANITATANVLSPLSVAGTRGITFGSVFPGLTKAVAYSDLTNGGLFTLTGSAGHVVSMTFTLPTVLQTSGGTNSLTINSWSGYYNTTNAVSGGSTFTPSATAQTMTLSGTAATDGTQGNGYVFVGASVVPTTTQASGTYTGTVTLSAVYTGT